MIKNALPNAKPRQYRSFLRASVLIADRVWSEIQPSQDGGNADVMGPTISGIRSIEDYRTVLSSALRSSIMGREKQFWMMVIGHTIIITVLGLWF